jgi:hypothetical protein
MTPPEKNVAEKNVVRRVGKPTLYERGCHRPIFASLAEAEPSAPANPGRITATELTAQVLAGSARDSVLR